MTSKSESVPESMEQMTLPDLPDSEVGSTPRPAIRRQFRPYTQEQLFLPMDVTDMIPPHHVVRVVTDAVNRLSDALFGGGRPPYHPQLMAKILVYAYTQRIYSSRQIAKAVREQIPCLWLTGRQSPDFRTINRFRGERMKAIVDEVFTGILALLIEQGYVTLETYFVDGTKIEANANRYTYVWKKSVAGNKTKLEAAIRELLRQIEAGVQAENAEYGERDLPEVEPQPLTVEALDAQLTQWEARLRPQPTPAQPVSSEPAEAGSAAPRTADPADSTSATPTVIPEDVPPLTPGQRKQVVRWVKM